MITVTVEKKYGPSGATSIKARISAPTIERAALLAGPNSRVVFPIDGEAFFAARRGCPARNPREGIDYDSMTQEEIEAAYEANLPGSREAYLDMLRDDLGEQGFEEYAVENHLV